MRNYISSPPNSRVIQHRQGAVLPLAAVMLVAFLAAAALAVDLAYIQLAETELRACLDGTARAGAQAISRGLNDAQVRAEVKAIAAENAISGEGLTLMDEDIVLGHATVRGNGTYRFAAGTQPTNAVRIIGRRSRDSANGSVSSLLGGLFGQSSYELERVAAATIQDRDIVVVADRSSSMNGQDAGEYRRGEQVDSDDGDSGKKTKGKKEKGASSGSEQLTRMEALKLSVDIFRDVLDSTPERESIGLAVYDREAETAAPLNTNYAQFDQAMEDLDTGGGTNVGLGIDQGLAVLREGRAAASRVMIVMTDGRHNGWRDPEVSAMAAMAEMPHLTIYTITFSPAADQLRMQRVAAIGGGEHHHADDYDELAGVFEHLARTAGSVLIE